MKPNLRRFRSCGFTIVELLTIMSIIIILISLLVPSLNLVKRYALYVKQKAHFKSIDSGLTMYNAEFDSFPDSSATDYDGLPYCGAMKLCEAMVGQDMLGFNPLSKFYQAGTDDGKSYAGIPPTGNDLYPARLVPGTEPPEARQQNFVEASEKERKTLYLSRERANVYRIGELFNNPSVITKFGQKETLSLPVLCDVYPNVTNRDTGKTVGMPILYYKANTRNKLHGRPDGMPPVSLEQNIYNFTDNIDFLDLPLPWDDAVVMGSQCYPEPITGDPEPLRFYDIITNEKIAVSKPYNEDSYILMSAGFDGLYGTADDVFNFEK